MTAAAALGLLLVPLLTAEDSARIFVYSPWDSLQHSRLKILFDGAPVAEIRPGQFFVVNADPGSHLVDTGEGLPTVVKAAAGGKYFVRVERIIEIGPSGKTGVPSLELRSAEQSRSEIVNLVYLGPKKIFSPVVSKEDPFLHERPKLK